MTEDFFQSIDELYNIILQPIDVVYKIQATEKYKKSLGIKKEFGFSHEYNNILSKNKVKGVVYTPKEISKFMINDSIKDESVIKNPFLKILDPACGCGNIVIPCFFHLKEIFKKNLNEINERHNLKLSYDDIDKHILKYNLFGYDIDKVAIKILIIELFCLTNFVSNNIKEMDFLMDNLEFKFHIFLGNPPYIGQRSMEKSYSKNLKKIYKEIYKDKGDISYCFFKKSLDNLNENGRITFITSRYFLESPSGEELRKVLKETCYVRKIVDFYGIRPFKNIGIDPLIIFLQNKKFEDYDIQVIKPCRNIKKHKEKFYTTLLKKDDRIHKEFYISKNLLNNKGWILRDKNERTIISKIEKKSFTNLNNICNSYQGIITGCDKAFVITEEKILKEGIEKEIIRPWIKSSYIDKFKVNKCKNYLIYSDYIDKEEKYPKALEHIVEFKDKLMGRRECKKGIRKWYQLQWGRSCSIFEGEKIVFPYKSNRNRFALDKGSFFSADIYCLTLKDNVPFTYEYLLFLLNSGVYEFYFKTFGKKLGEDMYEYYPNNLMKLCIPTMTPFEKEQDLYDFFEFTNEEIRIIKENIN